MTGSLFFRRAIIVAGLLALATPAGFMIHANGTAVAQSNGGGGGGGGGGNGGGGGDPDRKANRMMMIAPPKQQITYKKTEAGCLKITCTGPNHTKCTTTELRNDRMCAKL